MPSRSYITQRYKGLGSPTNGETIWQRKEVDPALQNGNIKTNKTDTKTGLQIETPPKECPCKQNRTEKRRDRQEPSLKAVVCGCVSPRGTWRQPEKERKDVVFLVETQVVPIPIFCFCKNKEKTSSSSRGRERCGRCGECAGCLSG